MSGTKEKVRKYQLIKFIGTSKNETTLLDIDCIPRHWVRYDIDKGQTVAKFPNPPYSKKKQTLLEHLIKTEGSPLPGWPEYAIELVGHANTYGHSKKRLTILETRPFAFTSDSDTAPQEKVAQIVEHLKKHQEKALSIEQIMEVPGMEDEGSTKSDHSISERNSSSSERSSASPSRKKITKHHHKGKKYEKKKAISMSQKGDPSSSKSQKSKELRSQKITPTVEPKKHQKVLPKHPKNISKTLSDSSEHTARTRLVTNSNINEGAYVVQESGELELLEILNETPSSSEKDFSPTDNTQKLPSNKKAEVEFPRLLTSTNFDKCLSAASDVLMENTTKDYSNDTTLILSALKGLSVDLKANTKAINNVLVAIQNSKVSTQTNSDLTTLVSETGFELPFKTLEEFIKFDVQLQDAKYRQHCAASLLFYVDRENHVTKSITNIPKKFVGRNVCMNFTAVKQMAGKESSPIFFPEIVTRHHTDNQGQKMSETYFFQCLGQAIANSKDWDGCRMERSIKDKAKREKATQNMANK